MWKCWKLEFPAVRTFEGKITAGKHPMISFLRFTPPAADTVAFNGNIMHVVLIIKAGMKTLALITDPQFSLESSHRANVSH